MGNLGFLKNLCLRDSSFLRINERAIFNEKKIVSPCGKKVLGRLLDVLGCELDECKEMDIFENPIFYTKNCVDRANCVNRNVKWKKNWIFKNIHFFTFIK